MHLASLPLALLLSTPALAATEAAKPLADETKRSTTADVAVRNQLDALDYQYEVDADGDYKLTFDLDNERSQLAFVISGVEDYGTFRIREVWAPAYRSPGEQLPVEVANRLLEDSQSSKMGGWVKQGNLAVFVVKIAADASSRALDDAIDYVVRAADQMEAELTPGKDEF
ncbi:YbjN domain-containing protein [Lysobacter cavernae]|uniref:YbjN domain-containing protein n=1 Tax=Lysobacter cavernae TaxID=1685901 RepID=A0ABV7RIQ4_9GAMM